MVGATQTGDALIYLLMMKEIILLQDKARNNQKLGKRSLHALILKYSPFFMMFIRIKILALRVIYKNKRQLSRVMKNLEKP